MPTANVAVLDFILPALCPPPSLSFSLYLKNLFRASGCSAPVHYTAMVAMVTTRSTSLSPCSTALSIIHQRQLRYALPRTKRSLACFRQPRDAVGVGKAYPPTQPLSPLCCAAGRSVCGCSVWVPDGCMYQCSGEKRGENGEVERTAGRRDCHYQMWSATGVSHRCSCMRCRGRLRALNNSNKEEKKKWALGMTGPGLIIRWVEHQKNH